MTELIKTRKQYEETLDFLKINRFAYDEANEIEDLIEALREVVNKAIAYEQTLAPFGSADEGFYHVGDELALDNFQDAITTLPDWIKEDG